MMVPDLMEWVVSMMEILVTAFFCLYVVKDHIRLHLIYVYVMTAVVVVISSFCFLAIEHTLRYLGDPNWDYSVLTTIPWMIIAYAGLSYVTKENKNRLFFVGLIGLHALFICRSVTLLCYSIGFPQLLENEYSWYDVLGFGIPLLLFMPLFALFGYRIYEKLMQCTEVKDKRIWMVPLFFVVLNMMQTMWLPVDKYVIANVFKIAIGCCAYLTYSQMTSAILNSAKAAKEAEYRAQLSHQLELYQRRITDMESYAEEMKRIRHDRRQHIVVLRGLLMQGKAEQALSYLNEYESSISEKVQKPLCENFVVDTLCRRYEVLAKQAEIDIIIHAVLPNHCGITHSDLAVILGNLWENAITATLDAKREHRFIQVWIQNEEDSVLIRMKNGYQGVIYEEDGRFLSTKPERNLMKGIGISSIQSVASSYGGMADFTYTKDIFTASIVLYKK